MSRRAQCCHDAVAICVHLLLAYLKFANKMSWSMSQILRLLQLNLFDRRPLLEPNLGADPPNRETHKLNLLYAETNGRRPSDADSRSQWIWEDLQGVSNKAASHRLADAQTRLDEETSEAFRKKEWTRVIELVDQYVAEGCHRSEHVNDDHETAYLAHLRADAYLGLGEFRKVIAIGVETASRFRATRDVFILYRSAVVFFREVEAHYRLGDFGDVVDRAGELAAWFGNYNHPDIIAVPQTSAWGGSAPRFESSVRKVRWTQMAPIGVETASRFRATREMSSSGRG